MKVHGDDVIAPGHDEHVGYKLGGDWCAGLVLLVHACVRKARDDCCDPTCGRRLACRDEDEELHEVVVHVIATRLDDEDILVPNRFRYLDIDFSIGEFFCGDGHEGNVKPV